MRRTGNRIVGSNPTLSAKYFFNDLIHNEIIGVGFFGPTETPMKMPSRPFFPGTMEPRPDIFGLHHMTIMGEACESKEEKQKRIATVEKGVLAAFKAAVAHLGEDQARQLFKRIPRRTKRGRGKTHINDRDIQLLRELDASPKGESITALAKRLHTTYPGQLGYSPEAIATQIRKLIKARKNSERATKVQSRYWRMATRNEKKSFLSDL
jgi:hypothetical protein